MKIIMVAVISKDGFITKGSDSDVSKWTSAEDKDFFAKIKSEHNLFVMGSKTFDSGVVLPKLDTLKIVLTTKPEIYKNQDVPGQLEFYNLNPKEFVNSYKSKFSSCLLLGGSYTYTEFLDANLVDEIYLTIEPVEHGLGISLLNNGNIDKYTNNSDKEITILNNTNTILKHYVLKK